MKYRIILALGSIVLGAGSVFSADAKTAGAAATQAAPATEAAPARLLSPEDQIRAQLDGTEWTVQLNPSAGVKGATSQKDTVTFTKKQVKSSFMEKAGYPASNYSLTIGGDGRAVWETMQTKEGEGVAFWRGEVDGSTMRGVLSRHPTEGASEDYSLSGQVTGGKKIVVPGAVDAASDAVSVPSAAPVVKQAEKALPAPAAPMQPEKKKKRGWF